MDNSTPETAQDFGKKHFTNEEIKDKVAEAMKDKNKFKEVMKKLSAADKETVTDIKRFTDVNQSVRRNAITIANEMKVGNQLNSQMSLNQKKKAVSMQAQLKNVKKMAELRKDGDVDCIVATQNGKISTTTVDVQKIEDEDKWVLSGLVIGEIKFIAICNSEIYSGRNKLAIKLLDNVPYGPVTFLMLDEDCNYVNLTLKQFKEILASVAIEV